MELVCGLLWAEKEIKHKSACLLRELCLSVFVFFKLQQRHFGFPRVISEV